MCLLFLVLLILACPTALFAQSKHQEANTIAVDDPYIFAPSWSQRDEDVIIKAYIDALKKEPKLLWHSRIFIWDFIDKSGELIDTEHLKRRLLEELSKTFPQKRFFFKGYGYEISSSLIEGQFPMWQKVVPNGLDHTVTIPKTDLEDAIKRTVIMAAKNGRIQMILDSDKMVISSPENEVGSSKEEIDAKYSGEPAEIALNAMYLSDVLKVIDSDDISIDFKFNQENKVSSALIVRPVDKENTPYTHVIMPMTF